VTKDFEKRTFTFDSVIAPDTPQKDIFDLVAKPVVDRVLEGYNGTIFAYGQTGTGKTFTMVGEKFIPEKYGIIPRSLEYIFHKSKGAYDISISFIQIYMEIIQDLLEPGNAGIKIREDAAQGVFITGVSWIPAGSVEQCMNISSIGEKNRAVALTALNAHSSRSHAVLMIKVERKLAADILSLDNPLEGHTTSILYLVDLAGSERVKKTKATANRLDEAKKINFSLSALGNCIHALTDSNTKHIPYRDSKLTRLLQDSLGGNAKTSMVVNIGPSKKHLDETLSSLKFGKRAMNVQNKPRINKKTDYKLLCIELQKALVEKGELLNAAEVNVKKLSAMLRVDKNALQENYFINNKQPENEIEQLKEALRRKDHEHKMVLEDIDKMMAEQEVNMNRRNEELNLKNEKKDKEIQRLRKELKDILELQPNQNIVKELQDTIEECKGQISEAMETIQAREVEISNMEIEIKEMKQQDIKLRETTKNMQKELDATKQIALINEEKLMQKDDSFNKLREEYEMNIREKTEELKKCKEQILVASKSNIETNTQIQELNNLIKEKDKEVENLKKILEKTKTELSNTLNDRQNIERSLQQLNKLYEDTKKYNVNLSNEVKEWKEKANELLTDKEKIMNENNALKKQYKQNEVNVKTKLENTKTRIAELQNEIKHRDSLIKENTEQYKNKLDEILVQNKNIANTLKSTFEEKVMNLSAKLQQEKTNNQQIAKNIETLYEKLSNEISSIKKEEKEHKTKYEQTLNKLLKKYKQKSIQITVLDKKLKESTEAVASYCTSSIVDKVCIENLQKQCNKASSSNKNLFKKLCRLELNAWANAIHTGLLKNNKSTIASLFSELISKSSNSSLFNVKIAKNTFKEGVKNTISQIEVELNIKADSPFTTTENSNPFQPQPSTRLTLHHFEDKKEINSTKEIKNAIEFIGELITLSDNFLLSPKYTSIESTFVKQMMRPLYNWIIAVSVGAIKSFYNNQRIGEKKDKLISNLMSTIEEKKKEIKVLEERVGVLKEKVNTIGYENKAHKAAIKIQKAWRVWLSIKKNIDEAYAMKVQNLCKE